MEYEKKIVQIKRNQKKYKKHKGLDNWNDMLVNKDPNIKILMKGN